MNNTKCRKIVTATDFIKSSLCGQTTENDSVLYVFLVSFYTMKGGRITEYKLAK